MERIKTQKERVEIGSRINFDSLRAVVESAPSLRKKASAEAPRLTDIKHAPLTSAEAQSVIKTASKLDDTTYTVPSGHVWRIANIDGEDCIVMDDDMTADNQAIDGLASESGT